MPSMPDDDGRDPWHAEGLAALYHHDDANWAVARAAELPTELMHHRLAAVADPTFEEDLAEWIDFLFAGDDLCLMLALEQSCDDGMLLPWDMRAVRLHDLPADILRVLHGVFDRCPRHVLAHLALFTYWFIRSERARRRGSPEWNSSMPLPPIDPWDEEPPAFKPMRTRPSRWP